MEEGGYSRLRYYRVLPNRSVWYSQNTQRSFRTKRKVCCGLQPCSALLTGVLCVCRCVRASSVDREPPRTAATAVTVRPTGETPRFGRLVAFSSSSSLHPPPLLLVFIITSSFSSSFSPCPYSRFQLFLLISFSTFSPPPHPLLFVLFLTSPSSSTSSPCPHYHLLLFLFIFFSSLFSPPPLPPLLLVHIIIISSSSLSSRPFPHLPLLFHLFSLSTL